MIPVPPLGSLRSPISAARRGRTNRDDGSDALCVLSRGRGVSWPLRWSGWRVRRPPSSASARSLVPGTSRIDFGMRSSACTLAELSLSQGARVAKQDDVIRVQGVVVETLSNATFRVEVDGGLEVLARAAGKMRRGRYIRILPGDRVDVELSAYDPTRGRIVWRYK